MAGDGATRAVARRCWPTTGIALTKFWRTRWPRNSVDAGRGDRIVRRHRGNRCCRASVASAPSARPLPIIPLARPAGAASTSFLVILALLSCSASPVRAATRRYPCSAGSTPATRSAERSGSRLVPVARARAAIETESFRTPTVIETNMVVATRRPRRFILAREIMVIARDRCSRTSPPSSVSPSPCVGVGMGLITGNHYWDVAGTAMIGLLLVAVAIGSIETGQARCSVGRCPSAQAIVGRRWPHARGSAGITSALDVDAEGAGTGSTTASPPGGARRRRSRPRSAPPRGRPRGRPPRP